MGIRSGWLRRPADILYRFALWLTKGEYTPFGVAFDIGNTSEAAISTYIIHQDWKTCGGTSEWDNGNGSPAGEFNYEFNDSAFDMW